MKPGGLMMMLMALLMGMGRVGAQPRAVNGVVLSGPYPVPGATVSIGTARGVSDSTGRFSLEVSPGQHWIDVSAVGYHRYRQKLLTDSLTGDIRLQLLQVDKALDELVVTGTSKPVHRLASPIAVEVYSPQFFRKNPAPSLFESMQNVNGVRPQINCSVCNTGDIHINGLEGPYTMVTIDGMPIVSSLSSVYGLFGIPSQLIERVEVVKGPASGLYGSEAIGGLINVITKSPEKAPRISANVMSTTWGEHTVDAGVRVRVAEKVHSLVGLHYFNYRNPVDQNKDGFTDVTLQHRVSLFNKWSVRRQQDRQASFAFRYFYEDRWGGDLRWNKSFRGSDQVYGEHIDTRRWELIGNYQLPVQERIFLSTSATFHDQDSYYGTTPYKGKQQIVFNQLRWEKPLSPRHEMVAGLAGRYTYYDDNSTATVDTVSGVNQPDRVFLPGIFLQDEWKLGGRHLLLLGLRYDHHPVHKGIITPRLGYKWGINDNQVFRLNAGTGFRVVNLFTEDHAALTGARSVQITENLEPEESYNVSLHFNQKLGNFENHVQLDASAWYTYFHNQIIADYDSNPQAIIYKNLDGYAVSRGISLNVDFSLGRRFKGLLGTTIQDVAKYEADQNGKVVKERPMFTESWSGTWSLSYTIPVAGLTFDYTGNVYGPMQLPLLSRLDPRLPRSPVWSLQNLQVTKWISGGWEIYGGVKNLLDWTPARGNPFLIARSHDPFDKEVDYNPDGSVRVTPQNPYGLTFDPTYVYAPNQGRRFFIGVRYGLK